MASLADFSDMVIQTHVLSNMTPMLWADPEGKTLESPIVLVSMDTLTTLLDDYAMIHHKFVQDHIYMGTSTVLGYIW